MTVRRVSLRWMLSYSAARAGIGIHDIFYNAVAGLLLRDTYGLSNMAIGFLANERSFIGSVLQPVIGGISDRTRSPLGRRRPFMLLAIPVTILGFLLLMAHPPTWLTVLVFILGPLAMSVAVIPYQALLPDSVVPEQRGTVNGVGVLMGMGAGMALLLAAWRLWERQEALVFLLVAAALAIGFLVTLATVREPPAPERPGPRPSLRGSPRNLRFRGVPLRPSAYLRDVLRYREATKYVACYFFFWFGIGGVTPFLTRFGKEELGIPEGQTFILLLVVLVATLLFAAPAGRLGDRYGKKQMMSWGLLAFAILIFISSQQHSLMLVVVILALAGLAQAITSVLSYPLFTELVPARRMGELTGLSQMVWSLAQPLGATALGAIADQTGTLRSVLMGAAAALFVSFLILQTVRVPAEAPSPALVEAEAER